MTDDLRFARVASHLFGRPLLVEPSTAQTIGEYVRSRMVGFQPAGNRFVGDDQFDEASGRWKGYRRVGNVGIVSIHGELVNRGAWLGARSGLTSYEGIVQQTRAAAEDDAAETIIFDSSSPGGEALGMADTARTLRRLTAGKRTIAVVNSISASAGYGLATAADEIVIGESGLAGSIGIVLVHVDQSKALEEAGIKVTVIHAGAKKPVGSPFGPLSEDDLNTLQAEVDAIMGGFVRLVADHRVGLSEDAVRSQEAGIFIGHEAVDAGLADRIGTFESVLDDLSRARSGRSPSHTRRISMSENQGAPAADTEAGIPVADHDAAVAAAREAGFEEGRSAGASDALTRLSAVLGADGIKSNGGRMAAALDLAAKSPDMDADAVTAFVTDNVAAAAAADQDAGAYEAQRISASGQAHPRPKSDTKTGAKKIDRKAIYDARRKSLKEG